MDSKNTGDADYVKPSFTEEQSTFFPKLNTYREATWSEIKKGTHFRYSLKDFNNPGSRKLVYAVCKDVGPYTIECQSYKPVKEWTTTSWILQRHHLETSSVKALSLYLKKQ